MNKINQVFPYLRTNDASAAIEFYTQAYGAVEDFRLQEPSGRIGHAELKFGDAANQNNNISDKLLLSTKPCAVSPATVTVFFSQTPELLTEKAVDSL